MVAERQLIARQFHRGQGGPQKPTPRLDNPTAAREKSIIKFRSNHQSMICRRYQLPKDSLLVLGLSAPTNPASIFVPAAFLQQRERLRYDQRYYNQFRFRCAGY